MEGALKKLQPSTQDMIFSAWLYVLGHRLFVRLYIICTIRPAHSIVELHDWSQSQYAWHDDSLECEEPSARKAR